jgi:elongator complex protein 1
LSNPPIIPVPDQNPKQSKISHYFRSIERGSILVCSSLNRVILQHPRGNLETVYPKILLFFAMKKWISERRYKEAYIEIRRHKLDMNLLVDIDQHKFVDYLSSGDFCRDFRKIDFVNLIIEGLQPGLAEDLKFVLSESEIGDRNKYILEQWSGNKVDYLCDAMRSAMNVEKEYFMLCIIMTYAKKTKPELK